MISPESIARIEASSVWRSRRVEVFDLPEGQVLVKGQRATRSPWPHRLLNTLAWMAGVAQLPVPRFVMDRLSQTDRTASLIPAEARQARTAPLAAKRWSVDGWLLLREGGAGATGPPATRATPTRPTTSFRSSG